MSSDKPPQSAPFAHRRVVFDLDAERKVINPATDMALGGVSTSTLLVGAPSGHIMIALPTGEALEIRVTQRAGSVLEEARKYYEEQGLTVPDYLK